MTILVAYATNSSGTLTASNIVAGILQTSGHQITHKDIREIEPQMLSQFDVVVFGSPSWDYHAPSGKLEGMPHEFFRTFIQKAHGLTLPEKKFAVFGLGDTAYIQFCGAVDRLESFIHSLEGTLITPSLRIDGFYFDQPGNEAKVAAWSNQLAQILQSQSKPAETVPQPHESTGKIPV